MSAEQLRELHASGSELPESWCAEHMEPHRCNTCHDGGRVCIPIRPGSGEDIATMIERRGRVTSTVLCPDCTDAPPAVLAAANAAMQESHHNGGAMGMVPPMYQLADLGSWRTDWNKAQRDAAFNYTIQWPPLPPRLFLTGGVGGGKTHMACVCGNELAARFGRRTGFYPVIDLLNRYRATMPDDAPETVAMIDAELRRCDLVILDDFGAHKPTEWATECLFRFIDEAVRTAKPLIVTTNVTPDAVDERIRSRLCDVRGSVVVEFKGDRRAQR